MAFLITKIFETRPPDVARDAWREISRRGMRAVADAWHHDILPEHFTERAKFKYRHKLRSVGYRKQKLRAAQAGRGIRPNQPPVIMGGVVDNVLTGEMMRMVKSSKAIRAFPTRVTLTMYGPRYMTMRVFAGDVKQAMREGWTYGRGSKFHGGMGRSQPDKAREIATVTREENGQLARVLETSVGRDLATYRTTPRTTTV